MIGGAAVTEPVRASARELLRAGGDRRERKSPEGRKRKAKGETRTRR